MVTIYITRHGETVWNTEKRMQGWGDSELTENGRRNARLLSAKLHGVEFAEIYCSPSDRTVETAKLLRGENDVPITLDDNLKEINLGEWEGQTHQDIERKYPSELNAFWNTPHLFQSINGESFKEVYERVVKVIKRIEREHPSGKILIVTHSVVIKCLFAYFKNLSLEQLWAPPYIHDTSLTVVEKVFEDAYTFLLEGDQSHRSAE